MKIIKMARFKTFKEIFFKSDIEPINVSVLNAPPPENATGEQMEDYIVNQITEMRKTGKDIDRGIDELTGTDYRVYTISDWVNAMRSADQPWKGGYRSNWVQLFEIFSNVEQDAHIQGAIDTLLEGLQSKEFYFVGADGEKDEETTELFNAKWFYDYIEAILNVKLWGFNLIQLDAFDPENLTLSTREIDRNHVRPDLDGIVKQQYDNKVYKSWLKEPFKTWTIFIFDKKIGKLNPCVRWYIYKTEIARFWARYNQMYGTPPVITKTSIKDRSRKENAINMMKKWQLTKWMVIDNEDTVEPFKTDSSASGQQFFENLIRLADEQMSKALLGSTMVMDHGSSRSQSETHAENTANFVKSTARLVRFTTNDELLPRLRKIGFPIPEGVKMVWDNSEKLTMKERAEVTDIMSRNFSVDPDTASVFVGLDVSEKEIDPAFTPTNPANTILQYQKLMNHDSD